MLNEGVNFIIKLRDFSVEEAGNYIDQHGEDVFNVAGVIDYSDASAKKLIDTDVAIKTESLKLEDNSREQILISPKILSQLEDYFKGVPKELIEEMLNRQKALSKI